VWDWARSVPFMLIEDASWQNQLLLQYLSRTPTPWEIDAEVGNLADDLLGPAPALSYLRYDALLEPAALEAIGLPELAERARELRDMSASSNRFDLATIGQRAAEAQVQDSHFPPAFDLPARSS
jgi:hypothetical protein